MKIGIDARKIRDFGIGIHLENLIRYIPEYDAENEYLIFHYPDDETRVPQTGSNIRLVPDHSPKYSLRELVILPVKMQRQQLDLFHAPHYTLPPIRPCKAVVTIHDAIHLRFPEYLPHPAAYYYAKWMMWAAAKSARKVITVSECSKCDLIEYLHIPRAKIEVVYNGIEACNHSLLHGSKPCQSVLERFEIPRPYLLYFGNFMPHKNLETLLKAYSLLKHRYQIPQCLVLAGKNERLKETLHTIIQQEQITQDVILTGIVEEVWKSPLYACADLFVYPSLYEGFGLQALEAMAHQIPVVITEIEALAEIAGDAAVRCDPRSAENMAEAIYAVLSDQTLRASLIEKGNVRVQAFSWRDMARKTVEIYHSVLQG